jgi:hypothetical protein
MGQFIIQFVGNISESVIARLDGKVRESVLTGAIRGTASWTGQDTAAVSKSSNRARSTQNRRCEAEVTTAV